MTLRMTEHNHARFLDAVNADRTADPVESAELATNRSTHDLENPDDFPIRRARPLIPYTFDYLADWTSGRSRVEILAHLGGHVPVGDVRDAAELMADPHIAARHMVIQLEHPGVSHTLAVAGQPLTFSRTPAEPHRRAPPLDEHGAVVRDALDQHRSGFRSRTTAESHLRT